jgi:hypothetical protein
MEELWQEVASKTHLLSPVANFSNAMEMIALVGKLAIGQSSALQKFIMVMLKKDQAMDQIDRKVFEPILQDAFKLIKY